jgi:hypothetical protein
MTDHVLPREITKAFERLRDTHSLDAFFDYHFHFAKYSPLSSFGLLLIIQLSYDYPFQTEATGYRSRRSLATPHSNHHFEYRCQEND